MARTSLACESCGQELLGTEDACPVCGTDLTGMGPGLLGRLPISVRQLAIVAGGVLMVVGSLLGWSHVERAGGIESAVGIDQTAGFLTLGAGALVIVFALMPRRLRWIGGWIAGAGLIVALYNGLVIDIRGLARDVVDSSVQPGLIIALVGSVIAFFPRYRVD